jgi:hypothetical protein
MLAESGSTYSAYKTPQLIDFGIAGRWPYQVLGRPPLCHGTQSFWRPVCITRYSVVRSIRTNSFKEQNNIENEHTGKPINDKSDIFNVGLVIMALINNRMILLDDPNERPKNYPGTTAHYTTQLMDLALKYVNLNPLDRPTLADLLFDTKEGLDRYGSYYGKIKGKGNDELLPFSQLDPIVDEFRIGSRPGDSSSSVKRRRTLEPDDEQSSSQKKNKSHAVSLPPPGHRGSQHTESRIGSQEPRSSQRSPKFQSPRNDASKLTVSVGPSERAKWEAIKEGKRHVRQEEMQPLRPSIGKSNEHNTSTSSHSARDAPAPEDKVPNRQDDSLGSLFEDDELPASQSRENETPASQSEDNTPLDLEDENKDSWNSFFNEGKPLGSQSEKIEPLDTYNENQDSFNSLFDDGENLGSQSEDNTPLDAEGENKDSLSSLFEDDGTSDYLPEEE